MSDHVGDVPPPPPRNRGVKKTRVTADGRVVVDTWDPLRRSILATSEFYRGVAEAVANSFSALDEELNSERAETDGLTCTLLEGLAEGNARFYETLAKSSRRVADHLRPERTVVVTTEIDYDRLARMIATELQKDTPARTTAPTSPDIDPTIITP